MNITLRTPCPACKGTGNIWTQRCSLRRCEKCDGYGYRAEPLPCLYIEPGVVWVCAQNLTPKQHQIVSQGSLGPAGKLAIDMKNRWPA